MMQPCIMLGCMLPFVDRESEMQRLEALMRRDAGSLAVVHGRRRLGKTRLLLEWCGRHGGIYTVADQSTPEIQRSYLAEALATRLPGFSEVSYPTWQALLSRLAAEASARLWRGPLVLDELPYLVASSPELPSTLQRFVDGPARSARLVLAIAGSSQRMMQGIVLSAEAPLFGRASVVLDIGPLPPRHATVAAPSANAPDLVETWCAWGGVPRYWELAAPESGTTRQRIERLVLDPHGALHREPDRLLIEEMPPALEVRPVLDAIGGGAERVTEIAGRMGRPATALSRPLDRLVRLGLVARDVPFGESERTSRRSLYRIADPFFRLWFRVVARHRGALASGTSQSRLALLDGYWPGLVARTWEDLSRDCVPALAAPSPLGRLGPWGPAGRWWHGNMSEWDVVSLTLDRSRLLLGESRWSRRPLRGPDLRSALDELAAKPPPRLSGKQPDQVVRALFVPQLASGVAPPRGGPLHVVLAQDVLGLRRRR
jgi:hypothetical protein